jgi:hypothetical protein
MKHDEQTMKHDEQTMKHIDKKQTMKADKHGYRYSLNDIKQTMLQRKQTM